MVGSNDVFELIAGPAGRVGSHLEESLNDLGCFERCVNLTINPRNKVGRRVGWCEDAKTVANFKSLNTDFGEGGHLRQ
jgi:hypothetical protein